MSVDKAQPVRPHATLAAVPGAQLLNPDALATARTGNAALERELLTQGERDLLDHYTQAAHGNAKILQRSINGSSETASLLKHQAGEEGSLLTEVLKHGASHVHPVAGLLARVLPALARSPDTSEALQHTLLSALLDPAAYNRIIGAQEPEASGALQFLRGLGTPARVAISRPAAFVIPRGLGPALSGTQ